MACQYYQHTETGADTFTVAMPKYTFGRGCLHEAGERAKGLGMTRIALFTDPFLKDGPYVATVVESLAKAGLDHDVFSALRIEPDNVSVSDGAKFLDQGSFDGVISIGGGSVIDTAKAAMIYHCHPDTIEAYFAAPMGAGKPIPGPVMKHIACPTTSGTGSECTSVSVIRLNDLDTKFVLGSPHLMPDEALVDPSVCDTLPATMVASTGFDLLCHALECYTARAYTRWDKVASPLARPLLQGANPWSDMAARRALEIAGQYLERGVADASDAEARDNLMWGASLAGMAFGNSGTHLPHAMSYGVTNLMRDITTEGYNVKSPFVPHGISVAVTAPAVFRYLASAQPERHLEAAGFLGAADTDASPEETGDVVAGRIIELMRATGVPNGIGGVGFKKDDAAALAASSVRQGRAIQNAPRIANEHDIASIYADAVSYW